MTTPITRRRFLTATFVAMTGPLLVRCSDSGGSGGAPSAEIEARAKRYDTQLDCSEAKALWPAEQVTRTDNEYRDRSTKPGQYCFTCSNFEKPKDPASCATCRTVKGPVHPLGWCKTWTELRS